MARKGFIALLLQGRRSLDIGGSHEGEELAIQRRGSCQSISGKVKGTRRTVRQGSQGKRHEIRNWWQRRSIRRVFFGVQENR